MTTANHALIGASIALVIKEPLLVIPLAFASHFVLDSIPHFGYRRGGFGEALKHKTTYLMESFGLIGLLILLFTINWAVWLTLVAALVAISPDSEWIYRFVFFERKGKQPPETALTRFHQKIQWCERPWGIFIEVGFFIIFYTLLYTKILHR